MRNPVRFEIDMGDVEPRIEGEAVFDASRVVAVVQLRHFGNDAVMCTCQKRCRLMFEGNIHDRPIVMGSLNEVGEKLLSAMRGGYPNVIGTDMMPYRGGAK